MGAQYVDNWASMVAGEWYFDERGFGLHVKLDGGSSRPPDELDHSLGWATRRGAMATGD